MKKSCLLSLSILLVGCAPDPAEIQNQNLAELDAQLMVLDLQNQDSAAARLHLQTAQALAPTDPEVLVATGYFDEKLGDSNAATEHYHQAIELAPRDPDIENAYGAFLYRQGAYQQALVYFEQAGADPENEIAAEADENAGLAATKLGQFNLAQQYFVRANKENPNLFETENFHP